jgi:hypothetical protein
MNYLAKARLLAESLKEHNSDSYIVLLMNDIMPAWFDADEELFDEVWTPFDLGYDEQWVFQHNVMELCTAVKGRALVKLLDEVPADIYAYFDPDVYVYDNLDAMDDLLEGKSIGLVPHITQPETTDIGVRLTEMSVTHHGIYNLGHLLLKGDEHGMALANWWADRLDSYCFNDPERGLFTDQRWMDLVPATFDSVQIIRSPNVDVASWNVRGREITKNTDGKYLINGVPLLTYHFSGTGNNGVHNRVRNIFNPTDIALAEIEREYELGITRHGQDRLGKHKFAYDYFDNGEKISDEVRKFYRRNPDLVDAFKKPYFTTNSADCLYGWLQRNRSDLVEFCVVPEYKLEQAFDGLFDESYYLAKYSEVADLIAMDHYKDAKDHYIRFGSANHYNPNMYFDSFLYVDKAQHHSGHTFSQRKFVDSDIEATVLWHYLQFGMPNRIEPNSFFDSNYYLAVNEDVKQAIRVGMLHTPLEHFFRAGDAEKRNPNEQMDLREIYKNNKEVSQLMEQNITRGVVETLIVLNRMGRYEGYTFDSETICDA